MLKVKFLIIASSSVGKSQMAEAETYGQAEALIAQNAKPDFLYSIDKVFFVDPENAPTEPPPPPPPPGPAAETEPTEPAAETANTESGFVVIEGGQKEKSAWGSKAA